MKKQDEQVKIDQLVEVSVLKYKMGYSQAKIADMLGVSAMTVSRMLDESIEKGIIRISVKAPVDCNDELSEELVRKFGLKDAFIVNHSPYEDSLVSLGKAAACYLDLSICPGDVLGIAAGRTLSQVMPYMKLPLIAREKEQLEVVQLQGGYVKMGDRNPINSIINFANRFGIRGHLLQHPMYLSSEQLAKQIYEHEMSSLEKIWGKCSILVSGVGIWGPHCVQREEDLLSEDDFLELEQFQAVGDLFGRWFDQKGNYIDCSCNRRVVSIIPSIQKNVPRKILVSAGAERLAAIRAVLGNALMNIFISDEFTARSLLEE